jgi:hypothetical protein
MKVCVKPDKWAKILRPMGAAIHSGLAWQS